MTPKLTGVLGALVTVASAIALPTAAAADCIDAQLACDEARRQYYDCLAQDPIDGAVACDPFRDAAEWSYEATFACERESR